MATTAKQLSVTVTTYSGTPDVDLTAAAGPAFTPSNLEIVVGTASVVAFSHDGVNDAGFLDGTGALRATQRDCRYKKLYVRVVSGANPATVYASLWAT